MKVSLVTIIDKFKEYAEEYPYIETFSDDLTIEDLNDGDLKYPLFWVRPDEAIIKDGCVIFPFKFLIVDKADEKSRKNKQLSDMAFVLEQFFRAVKDNEEQYEFHLQDKELRAKSIANAHINNVLGYQFSLNIKVESDADEAENPIFKG